MEMGDGNGMGGWVVAFSLMCRSHCSRIRIASHSLGRRDLLTMMTYIHVGSHSIKDPMPVGTTNFRGH